MNMHGENFDVPTAKPISGRKLALIAMLLIAGGIAACLADVPIARLTVENRHATFDNGDFARFLRSGGYLPAWLVVGAALIAERRGRTGTWRGVGRSPGVWLIASTILAGVFAEVAKLLARRKRLTSGIEWYEFRSFGERMFDSSGLSLPSSHAIIAFAAAYALGRAYPATRWVLIPLAVGTAFSRVHMGAHYVSDTYASALLAWPCALFACRMLRPREQISLPATPIIKPDTMKAVPIYVP
jgi:membrane-associated phospholipid phosphatase